MTKHSEKNTAVELRQQGFSYAEISEKLEEQGIHVSKGSLSNWLKRVDLTPEQKSRLREREEQGGEKGRKIAVEKRTSKVGKKLIEGFSL